MPKRSTADDATSARILEHTAGDSAPPSGRASHLTSHLTSPDVTVWLAIALHQGNRRYLDLVVFCMTFRHTLVMTKAISVRLDNDAEQALRMLEATGLSRSEAIRTSLLAAAERMRRRHEVAREAAALEADDADRAEMLAVASLMESMRAAG